MELGTIGVWSGTLRRGDSSAVLEAAAELEDLGYGTIWFPGGERKGLADHILAMLGRTRRAVVATGIVNVWTHPAAEIAVEHHDITRAYPGRFLLGVGIGHREAAERIGQTYEHPLQRMTSYLDELDSAPTPVPVEERILAALGPRMLELARDRSCGAHPYFVPTEHTRIARKVVGQGKIVAPEHMVVLESNAARARQIARMTTERYLRLPNYTNNLRRLGFTDEDLTGGGSDRLVDAIVAWGDAATVMAQVREHHAAGADHVCVQVLTDPPNDLSASLAGWRQLATAF
jgi:probable F420-dependent oxidoreductase